MDRDRRARDSATAPAPGAVIGGRVRLERPLASGAMGSVWTGHHLALDVEVAVKFIRPEVFQRDPRAEQRFEREARAAARIKSPHVVQTFDCGITEDGAPYLVMELLEGETLGQRLDRSGPLEPAEVVAVVGQVGRALDRAHGLGIVHRDVKPQNIFLVRAGPEPLVKLLDFGIAKLTEMPVDHAATQTGVVVGTPQYMSPEQLLRPKAADHRGDLWALAVVAYHALAGVPPFTGETLAALIVSITQSKFARVRAHRPELPTTIDAWFDRALGIEPDSRFASARELGDALAAALGLSAWTISSSSLRVESDDGSGDTPHDSGGPGTEALAIDEAGDTAAFLAARELELAGEPAPGEPAAERPQATAEPPARTRPSRGLAAPEPAPQSAAGEPAAEQPAAPRGQALDGDEAPPRAAATPSWRRGAPLAAIVVTGLALGGLGWRWAASRPSTDVRVEPAATDVASPALASSTAAERRPAPALEGPSSASATATESGAAPHTLVSASIAPTDVAAGRSAETNAWLPRFTVARHEGDEGRSWLEALDACRERGSSLCTESQWVRACEAAPALGARPSWTASASTDRGFVVRGGHGCSTRSVTRGDATDHERGGACCTRAVGLRSDSSSTAFLQTTSARLLLLERALDGLDEPTLSEVLATEVDLGGARLDRDAVLGRLRKQLGHARERGSMHDVCEVRLTSFEGEPGWTADCHVVVRTDDRVGYVLRRYLYGGPDGKLRSVAEPKILRMPAPLGPSPSARP